MLKDVKSTREVLRKLNYILTKRQRWQAVLVLCMTMLAAVLETVGVSIIMPLVEAMISPRELMENPLIAPVADRLSLDTPVKLLNFLCICTIILYLVKNIYMCLFTYVRAKYSNKIGRELATRILKAYTRRKYTFFLSYSSGECLRDTGTDVAGVSNFLNAGFTLLTDCITIGLIVVWIFVVNYQFALIAMLISAVCLTIVLKIFRNLCREWGERTRINGEYMYKYSLELFQGIKEIKILGRQKYIVDHYDDTNGKQGKINSLYTLSLASPAYIIEALFIFGFLTALCLGNNYSMDMVSILPELASFAIAAFRVLPSLGKISSSVNNILYSVSSVNATYQHVQDIAGDAVTGEEPGEDWEKAQFHGEISVNHISWQYPTGDKKVIDDLCMQIKKGESVAFIGSSGAGKTTLADIILGLLEPQSGNITLDGRDIRELGQKWRNLLGYVPQSAYLISDTIRRNVAFGIEDQYIDEELLWRALEQAQLKEFVEQLPQGLDTEIGESGVRVSGGQRQRLAIARALYKDPEILVMDEATSALDGDTEKALIEAIEKLQGHKTMIVVAHRLTTVKNCDIIYEIGNGVAVERDKREIFGEE